MTPHGITGYCNYRCRCAVCVAAWRGYRAEYGRKYRAGERVHRPAEPVRERLLLLVDRGHTIRGIAGVSGVSYQTIANVLLQRYATVNARTEDAIMGVALTDMPDGGHLVPKEHAQRLVAAMRAAGISGLQMKRWLGYAPGTNGLGFGRCQRVRTRSHRRVVVLYQLLARAGRVDPSLLIGVPQ